MPWFFQICLFGFSALLAFVLVREIWIGIQIRCAVRRDLIIDPAKIVRISSSNRFQDCGSFRTAFRVNRTYRLLTVAWKMPAEEVHHLEISAVFKPFTGWLCRVEPFCLESVLAECSSGEACPTDLS